MKKRYIKPAIETFLYEAEEGYKLTVALDKDYVLIEGSDGNTLRASEEVTEYTNPDGEYEIGIWE